jgi:periplasmic divalent cation tolerance protein
MSEHLMVLCTCPDGETAEKLASHVVDERLAACVNIIPALTSVYRWEGSRQQDAEVLLLVKTTRSAYQRLEEAVRSLHPYELPEIIAVSITTGLAPYLHWINDSCETTR